MAHVASMTYGAPPQNPSCNEAKKTMAHTLNHIAFKRGAALATRPEYVHTIGMITIELANLEMHLGTLLGSLLHVSPEAGRTTFLSPTATLGRLAMIENVLDITLAKNSGKYSTIQKLLGKIKAAMGKRHRFIHGAWGVSSGTSKGEVHWHGLPFSADKPPRLVPISELEDLVAEIRRLTDEVDNIAEVLYGEWPPYTSHPKKHSRASARRKKVTASDK